MSRVVVPVALFLLIAASASARQQSVQLEFQDGRVTLRAQNAPVGSILVEWARLGGATIVNGDRVAGPPLTLELTGVLERQALDIVLRDVAGYMLAPRRATAAGTSAFDRIVILPTSVAPPPAPAATTRPTSPFARPPVIARPPAPMPPAEAAQGGEPADVVQGDDTTQSGQPLTAPGLVQPRVTPRPLVRPPLMPPPGAGPELVPEQPEPEVEQPETPPAVMTRPGNPFGVPAGSSNLPGVIAPAPQPQPQQPQQ